MTGSDKADAALAERRRTEQRKNRWAIAAIAGLALVLVALMVPWLLGRRQVDGDLRAVAELQQPDCWIWRASAEGRQYLVTDPPDSWLGSTSVRGEVFVDGDEHTYFAVASGERYLLTSAATAASCPPPPTTTPLR